MLNSDIEPAVNALEAIGPSAVPMHVAIRMTRARRILKDRHADVVELRNDLIRHFTDGDKQITQNHPLFHAFMEKHDELYAQECETPDTFKLFARNGATGPEYSWSRSFDPVITAMPPQVLFGLDPMLEIVSVDDKAGD